MPEEEITGTWLNGQNNKFNTRYFKTGNIQKLLAELDKTPASESKNQEVTAMDAGFYFEALIVDALREKFKDSSLPLDGKQKNAKEKFSAATSPEGKKLRSYVQAAAQTLVDNFDNMIQELAGDDRVNIVSNEASGASAQLADILVETVSGKKIAIELKWQSSHYAKVRRFSNTADSTLFGSGFYKYLINHKNTYWSHKLQTQYWTDTVTGQGLSNFLGEKFQDNTRLVNYLLGKGEVSRTNKLKYDAKVVVHGTYGDLTITNINDLAAELAAATKGTGQGKTYKNTTKSGIVFNNNQDENLAVFYVEQYLSDYRANHPVTDKDGNVKQIHDYTFTFAMFISQRLLAYHYLSTTN